ncbi:MAG TPA: Trp biosynthesis-associated membrane protein [Mycobacteriales bacterium]|nr:Trp biosynthesis-associated membrane protein [Mycobacteriales bacterium]
MTPRSELALAVGLTVSGAVLLLLAAGQPWARVLVPPAPPLPGHTTAVTGRVLVPVVPAAGLLGLAAVTALWATRGGLRRALGAAVLVGGLAVAVTVARSAAAEDATILARASAPGAGQVTVTRTGWPVAGVAGGLLIATAGALTVVRGGRWPGLGSRHERVPRAADRDRDLWDALDRGEDPTL